MRLNGTSVFSTINCNENNSVPTEIQILRVGKFNHPTYGFFEITAQVLAEMKANFDSRVRGVDLALDYFHESDKEAAGWFEDLLLKEDGKELWAKVRWTPTAEKKLSHRELRYFSPDFTFKWQDPESGKIFTNVLFGGGLTNRPFVKEMQAIVATENKGDKKMDEKLKELEAKNLKLGEDMKKLEDMGGQKDAQIAELQKQIEELKAQLAKSQADMELAAKEKAKLQEDIKCKEKEQEFAKLLSEGKAVVAQKEAFMKGDMSEFIKLSQPINLKANGSGGKENEGDAEDKVMKLAEEIKTKEGVDMGTAISKALKQINKGDK